MRARGPPGAPGAATQAAGLRCEAPSSFICSEPTRTSPQPQLPLVAAEHFAALREESDPFHEQGGGGSSAAPGGAGSL